jgi:hypothetical protein
LSLCALACCLAQHIANTSLNLSETFSYCNIGQWCFRNKGVPFLESLNRVGKHAPSAHACPHKIGLLNSSHDLFAESLPQMRLGWGSSQRVAQMQCKSGYCIAALDGAPTYTLNWFVNWILNWFLNWILNCFCTGPGLVFLIRSLIRTLNFGKETYYFLYKIKEPD